MKNPIVELNSLLKFFCLSHGLKTANYYRRNILLKLSQESTTHYLNLCVPRESDKQPMT